MTTKVTYLGHSTVLIDCEKRIVIDPWLETNPKCPAKFHNLENIEIICLTHGHSDHTGSALTLAKRTGATVCATYELLMLLVKEGLSQDQIQPMNKGGCVKMDSLTISLTHAFHSSSYDATDGNTYYAGEACGVVIKTAAGDSIYHAGDTALFSDMKLIAERHKPTVALVPIGDRFTMGPKDAAVAAELIKPKVVIPIHWGTFGLLSGTPEAFAAELKESEVEVRVLQPGENTVVG